MPLSYYNCKDLIENAKTKEEYKKAKRTIKESWENGFGCFWYEHFVVTGIADKKEKELK
jgi:hypothetical protein